MGARSARERIGAEAIVADRAAQAEDVDEIPDRPDQRDKLNEDPPARLVAVVKALDADANPRPDEKYESPKSEHDIGNGRQS